LLIWSTVSSIVPCVSEDSVVGDTEA
jgi:hypothetical protein